MRYARRVWSVRLAVVVVGLMAAGCTSGPRVHTGPGLGHGTRPGPPIIAPTVTFPRGTRFQPVSQVVVRQDDRTLVTDASWGGCDGPPAFTAAESVGAVTLALTEPPTKPGQVCPAVLRGGTVHLLLRWPLGRRTLREHQGGGRVMALHESALAKPTFLPPGLRLTAIAPGGLWAPTPTTTLPAAVVRYYQARQTSPSLRLVEAFASQLPDGPTGWPTDGSVSINGRRAQIRISTFNSRVVERQLTWSSHGHTYLAISSGVGNGPPMSAATLVRVLQGLQPA
jgi:hypothetical protein